MLRRIKCIFAKSSTVIDFMIVLGLYAALYSFQSVPFITLKGGSKMYLMFGKTRKYFESDVLPELVPTPVKKLSLPEAPIISAVPETEEMCVSETTLNSRRIIRIPGDDQVSDLAGAIRLANAAEWVILTDRDGRSLTGKGTPEDIIRAMRDAGLRCGVVVFYRYGALAWTANEGYAFAPALGATRSDLLDSACIPLADAFSAALCDGENSIRDALAAGNYAADRVLWDLAPLPVSELMAWGKMQSKVDLATILRAKDFRKKRDLVAGATIAGIVASILPVILFS